MKKISVALNEKSIAQAIKEIEAYQKRIQNLIPDFLIACANEIKTLANRAIDGLDYDESIKSEMKNWDDPKLSNDKKSVLLQNSSEKATYIEFGVGQVGETQSKFAGRKEAKEAGYEYDVNNHGDDGWTFRIKKDKGIDIPEKYRETKREYTKQRNKRGEWVEANPPALEITTRGAPATSFLFNVFMNFCDKGEYAKIWKRLTKDL